MSTYSFKHHYLPKFYLNGFTNKENLFYIYLVKEKRFKKRGKLFSPESHFFELNANTLMDENGPFTDFLETMFYNDLDNDSANVLGRIRKRSSSYCELSYNDVAMLQFFISTLFWRNPQNYFQIAELLKKNSFEKLGFQMVNTTTNGIDRESKSIEEMLKKDPNFFKTLKAAIPLANFQSSLNAPHLLKIYGFPTTTLPSICGDNPIFLMKLDNIDICANDLILPISKDLLIICAEKIQKEIPINTKIAIDIFILKQSSTFVCCTDKNYPIMLENVFVSQFKTIENLKKFIYKTVFV